MQEASSTRVRSLGGDDPLVEGMATNSNILARIILWTEKHGGGGGDVYSPWGRKELDMIEVT